MKIAALVAIDGDFWRGRRVLVSGHTGFKGAWLSLWLQHLGAEVCGLAPGAPTTPSLFELAHVGDHMQQHAVDVRDARAVLECVRAQRPQVVFHMAAQPMVRRSLAEPAATFEINVMGTVNVLEAVRALGEEVQATVVVSSDKCYENDGSAGRRFSERDALGGADPYSSSKACAELVTSAYRRSFFGAARLASARAGNVIGGGDWGQDRLLADAVRAVEEREALLVRNPLAVRPWQHVLNALSGYMLLAQELCAGARVARAFNFGPRAGEERSVAWVLERLAALWGGELRWERDVRAHPPESPHLALDCGDAERELGWRPTWDLEEALEQLVRWHRAQRAGERMREVSLAQLSAFCASHASQSAAASP